MAYVARHCNIVRLRDLPDVGSSKRPNVAITFDDGYQSNHDLALPVLQEFGLPATVFLNTAYIGTCRAPWFCDLIEALSTTKVTSLTYQGREYALTNRANRRFASEDLQKKLKALRSHDLLEEKLNSIVGELGVSRPIDHAGKPTEILDKTSVVRMQVSGLIDFGGHTHSHKILAHVPEDTAAAEIETSLRLTQELTNAPQELFAYPNGGPGDIGSAAERVLRKNGISLAVTTSPKHYSRQSRNLRVPRYPIGGHISDAWFRAFIWGQFQHYGSVRKLLKGARASS